MTQKATFLDRNKKKSALAALLLFLRERKALIILLLLLLVATTAFITPSSTLAGFPGGARLAGGVAWIAQKMGVDVARWGLGASPRSYSELVAAFRAAKEDRNVGWSSFLGKPASNSSSLDFVQGHRSDLGGAAVVPPEGGVKGILNPEDARADGRAVAVDDAGGEHEGFVKDAFAGGFAKGLFGDGTIGAYASKGFFGSGPSAASGPGEYAQAGADGLPKLAVPKSKIQGAAKGKLSAMASAGVETRSMSGVARASLKNAGSRAFIQLAQGRGRASLATSPACTPPNCPGEFAATNTGAIYDGNDVGPASTNLLTAPQVDGIQSPNVPDSGLADGYEKQAEQMDADAQKCRDLDAQYGPEETSLNQQMQSISNQFKSADCGGGGCSQSKANYCQGLGNQLHAVCSQYMSVRCAHTHACPLTANANCSNECSQTGNATQKQTIIVTPDVKNNSDGSGSKTAD